MESKLSDYEIRVIGCLIEKATTTPDQYPLSLNALTNACNQKSNREPVMKLDETTVQNTLDDLVKKRLAVEKSPFGGRTAKYQHRFCNTEFSELHLSPQELGILCVMFLRGPQTPGELRTRTNRLCEFSDVNEVEQVLEKMSAHQGGALVRKLPRQAGKRESRYIHLFGGVEAGDGAEPVYDEHDDSSNKEDHEQRIQRLEQQVNELQSEMELLREIVERLS